MLHVIKVVPAFEKSYLGKRVQSKKKVDLMLPFTNEIYFRVSDKVFIT